jgi:hypothetical protein
MADLKISQLPAATTPVVGTEVLPIVQSGTTSQVSINSATGITRPFTANGVVYASSSSALTTGSALQFDGTNLGIGTSSPSTKLDAVAANPANQLGGQIAVSSSTAYATGNVSGITFRANDSSASLSTYASIQMKTTGDNAGALTFVTRSSAGAYDERMRIDSSGNLGLGVTPSAWGTSGAVFKAIEYGRVGNAVAGLSTGPELEMLSNAYYNGGWKYANTGVTALRASLNGDTAGAFSWNIAPSGTAGNAITFTQAMTLDASGNLLLGGTSNPSSARFVSENASGNQIGLRYTSVATWYNSVDSSGNYIWKSDSTERARIDSSGNLLVGTTASAYASGERLSVQKTSGGNGIGVAIGNFNNVGIGIYNGYTATGTATAMQFQDHNSVVRGSITVTTTGTLYNVTSDQRLKENIVDAPEFGNVIDSIQVRSFDWKTSNTHQRAGFVAQELVTVAPEAVHQPTDPDDMMAVDYSKLVPMLVKEIQSLRKRLAALEKV